MLYNFLLLFLIVFINFQCFGKKIDNEINKNCTKYKFIEKTQIIGALNIFNELNFYFDYKDGINFNCLQINSYNNILNLIPNKPILVLDDSFKIIIPRIKIKTTILIQLINIKAINYESNFLIKLSSSFEMTSVNFFYSKFMAISNDKKYCLPKKSKNLSFFGKLSSVGFGFSTSYYEKTCPYIFSNSIINLLEFYGISDTFLKTNKLGFLSANNSLNSSIEELTVMGYEIDLNENMLDNNIFAKLNKLNLNGKIQKISIHQINNLVSIGVKLDNLIQFLFFNKDVFKNSRISKFRKLEILNIDYKFPDEDFCIFKIFHNLYWLEIKDEFIYSCSCTLVMLFISRNIISQDIFYSICDNSTIDECQIEKRLKNCNISTGLKHFEFSYSDFIYNSELLNFLTIIMTPIFSFISILLNSISLKVLIVLLKTKNSLLYKLMMVNNAINLVYSIISSIHLINKCVYVNGIFCSAILREKAVQLFDIIFVEFLLSVLKIWSNVSLIGISWLRLIILIKDKSWVKPLVKFQKEKKFKILIAFLLGISVVISMDKLFVVRINENFFVMDERDYEEFPNKNTFMIMPLRDLGQHSISEIHYHGKTAIFFYVLFVFNFIFNDFLLYAILLLIDVFMLYYFNSYIREKNKLTQKLKTNEEKNLKEAESKINITVLVNLFFVLFLKIGHFGVSFYIFMSKILRNTDTNNICFLFSRVCSNYLEFSEQFFILSNALSIFLFINLSKSFKESFYNIFVVKNFYNCFISTKKN